MLLLPLDAQQFTAIYQVSDVQWYLYTIHYSHIQLPHRYNRAKRSKAKQSKAEQNIVEYSIVQYSTTKVRSAQHGTRNRNVN